MEISTGERLLKYIHPMKDVSWPFSLWKFMDIDEL
jgi:hypothetical protein